MTKKQQKELFSIWETQWQKNGAKLRLCSSEEEEDTVKTIMGENTYSSIVLRLSQSQITRKICHYWVRECHVTVTHQWGKDVAF